MAAGRSTMKSSNRGAIPSARSGYRLQSPFATNEEFDRPVSALDRTAEQAADPALSSHVAPSFDSRGFELPRGKGSGLGIHKPGHYNNAAGQAVVPGSWLKPAKHAVVADLKESRRKEFIPDPSFDIDGDGIVSPMDYFYAQQFDVDRDGKLNREERRACLKALSNGYGRQFFHVKAGAPAVLPEHRVLQRRGQILAEDREGWLPLHATYGPDDIAPASQYAPFANAGPGGTEEALSPSDERRLCSTMGIRTRSDLLRARRKREAVGLSKVGGDETNARDEDAVSVASFVATKPFNTTAEFTSTAANRTALMKQRKKENLKHVLSAQGLPADVPDTARTDATDEQHVTMGLSTLSRARSQLLRRRKNLQKKEASKAAPTKPLGLHQKPLPSYAERHGEEGEWWKDNSHLASAAKSPWEGSDLEGSRRDIPIGGVTSGAGKRVDASTGKPLVKCGRPGETDDIVDSFKARTTSLMDLPLHRKKRMDFVEKPNKGPDFVPDPGRVTKKHTYKRWTDVQIEYKLSGEDQTAMLDEFGKSKVYDPTEYAPLYSSFSADRQFRAPQHIPTAKKDEEVRSRRRRSVYGTPVLLPGQKPETSSNDGADGEDMFDSSHRVDYESRRGRRRHAPNLSSPLARSRSAPNPSSLLASSPIARSSDSPARGFGHDGDSDSRRAETAAGGARPRTEDKPTTLDPPLGASMTRALSRSSARRAMPGSRVQGSFRSSGLTPKAAPSEPVGVRSGGFQRTMSVSVLVS